MTNTADVRASRLLSTKIILGLMLLAPAQPARAQPAAAAAPSVSVDGQALPAQQPAPAPAPPPAPPPAPEPLPTEGGLAAIQIAVGSVGMVATFLPIGLLLAVNQQIGVTSLLVAPTAGGFIVCGIGGTSRFYEGGCAPAVLGAYLGALTAIPLAFLGCSFDRPRGDIAGCANGAVIGFIAGFFVGTAAGATLAWHLAKKPKPPLRLSRGALPRPAIGDPWPESRHLSSGPPLRGARFLVPLIAFEF